MSWIRKEVDRQFSQLHAKRGDYCQNPITGGAFVWAVDSIAEQKLTACRALVAREIHRYYSPGAPALPVDVHEIESLKCSCDYYLRLFAYFARSIAARGYTGDHPPFEIYASGALASPHAPKLLKQNATLTTRFPPRPMHRLGPGLVWTS